MRLNKGSEKRQARRIARLAHSVERHFFELIEDMQGVQSDDEEDYGWEMALQHLSLIADQLPLLFDLVKNTMREMGVQA